jgi:DNA-binding CsgD family transcriptional regulator
VRSLLSAVQVPTIVIHARGDARIPIEQGRLLATEIPGARFVTLEGRNHILIEEEPAWDRFCETFDDFLGVPEAPAKTSSVKLDELTARENDILHLVALGHGNADIAKQLFISEKTVRNHLTSIFEKLGIDSRAKAIVVARDRGF